MKRCPHCDREIRFYTTHLVTRDGEWWHYACANEQHEEQNRVIDAARLEDWELEARRHLATLQGGSSCY